jgi:hypothetical protein
MHRDEDRTPETRITADLALRVYQKIVDHGERQKGIPVLHGVSALLDPDGYGVTLSDGTVSARILFHNRVAIDTPGSRALMRFRRKLVDID